jgi:hypothetical protein
MTDLAMKDQGWIHEVVGRVASEVLASRVDQLRDELVRRAVEEVQPSLSAGSGGSEKLLAAVAQVQTANGQRDILHALLDQAAGFCARSAVFVVKPDSIAGWQAIGFPDDDAVRDFTLDSSAPLLRKVLQERAPSTGYTTEMDTPFLDAFGAPVNGECHLLPLFLKDKLAAVLYADAGGADASCERASLDLLVRFTSIWLEVQAARKASHPGDDAGDAASETLASAPPETAKAAAAGLSTDAPESGHAVTSSHEPKRASAHVHAQTSAAAAAPARVMEKQVETAPAPPAMSAADADTHKKAQRFARLLIDEIKLYNKGKLEEGAKQRDLYDRLRDDIDKSRATYTKRYGTTAAASGDYFIQELIRSLAQGDASLLGPNFKR